jgi:hypothetical protein
MNSPLHISMGAGERMLPFFEFLRCTDVTRWTTGRPGEFRVKNPGPLIILALIRL